MDPKRKFIDHLTQLAITLYRLGDGRDGSPDWLREQTRLRGFSEAGRIIELVSAEEIQHAIDNAHLKVFGETRQQRRDRLGGPQGVDNRAVDWEQFETPTFERRR